MVENEEQLKQSLELKKIANAKAKEVLTELEKKREDVQKLSQEKSNIETKLKFKDRECQLLSGIIEDKVQNQYLQNKIAKKKKKIKRLKEELEKKEGKLLSVQQVVQTLKEELSKARAEEKKKHEEVTDLQRENKKLACSYNIRKEQVSHLIQIAIALTSENKEQIKVLTNILDSLPVQCFILYKIMI